LQESSAYGSILSMVAARDIKAFCRRLAVEYRPSRIVLFGSYARGEPRPDSDVDLLVVMPFKGSGVSKAAEMIRKLSPSFAVDLVIRRPADVERRVAMNDFFLKEATNGRLLYEAPDA
jgi:predicted nucleotidyltransferase